MIQEFYTINDLQDLLQISRISIYRYIKKGDLKTHKFGNNHRIRKSDLEEFLNKYKKKD